MADGRRFAPLLRFEDYVSVRLRRKDVPRIRALLALKDGARLLDVGGGTGGLAALLVGESARATVLEPDGRKVAFGRRRHARVEFLEGHAEQIPLPDASFERATAMLSLHHMADPERALREVHRILAPAGRFLLQEFHPRRAPGALGRRLFRHGPGAHHRFYDPADLKAALAEAGFHDVAIDAGNRTYYVLAVR